LTVKRGRKNHHTKKETKQKKGTAAVAKKFFPNNWRQREGKNCGAKPDKKLVPNDEHLGPKERM